MISVEVIKANKYHFDRKFKFKDVSSRIFTLENKQGLKLSLPKKEIKIFQLAGGDVELHIPEWLYKKESAFLC